MICEMEFCNKNVIRRDNARFCLAHSCRNTNCTGKKEKSMWCLEHHEEGRKYLNLQKKRKNVESFSKKINDVYYFESEFLSQQEAKKIISFFKKNSKNAESITGAQMLHIDKKHLPFDVNKACNYLSKIMDFEEGDFGEFFIIMTPSTSAPTCYHADGFFSQRWGIIISLQDHQLATEFVCSSDYTPLEENPIWNLDLDSEGCRDIAIIKFLHTKFGLLFSDYACNNNRIQFFTSKSVEGECRVKPSKYSCVGDTFVFTEDTIHRGPGGGSGTRYNLFTTFTPTSLSSKMKEKKFDSTEFQVNPWGLSCWLYGSYSPLTLQIFDQHKVDINNVVLPQVRRHKETIILSDMLVSSTTKTSPGKYM